MPTGRSDLGEIPIASRCAFGPTPLNIKSCGDAIVPTESMISFLALMNNFLNLRKTNTPVLLLFSISIFVT